ncbi:phosphodiesterase YaeI [Akkermansia glycaniphila]|uniref:phosphodiesterase YaeI n=1 Tax=Akkermansia glycaniphila TaxID=1679444 RepID=UPI001C02078C|nr:phosphodiesterase YaeI [Akkermansia glycaniphila]MBT9450848.1 phosphodiesterase YaeI [Akkermansia glycaniphila]
MDTPDDTPQPGQPRRFWTRRRFLTAGLLAAAGTASYGWWEADRLECNVIRLPKGLLPGIPRLRILHLSDMHDDVAMLRRAIDKGIEAKPDFAAFTGDLVTSFTRLARTRSYIEPLKYLAERIPCYACYGNHDMEKLESVERIFQTAGIRILRNESALWTAPDGRTLRIAGIGDWTEGDEDPGKCLQPLSDGTPPQPVIVLSHNPESRFALEDYYWNLMLCGHTHGGQIGIPFTGKYLSFRGDMVAGLYPFDGKCDNRQVFVTRGVGNIGGMRFFCPPEVDILEYEG